MAAKSTKGKKNTKSTAKKTQQKSGQSQNRDEIRGEIIILGLLAVCILLVLSNFGLGGIVGKTVSSVVFGIFGFMAYFLPFILFGAVAFGISNKGNSHAYIKLGAVAALFLILCGMIELLFHPYDKNATLFSYYVASSEHKNAGGFAGGCLIRLFCLLFGKIGAGGNSSDPYERAGKERKRAADSSGDRREGSRSSWWKREKGKRSFLCNDSFAWGRRRGSTAGEKKQKAEKIS